MNPNLVFDISQPVTWIPLVAGVIIPFLVAYLTTANASGTLKSVVAFVSACLVALGTYLGDVSHAHTLKGATNVVILALVAAVVSRFALTGHKVAVVQEGPSGIIGPTG